MVERTATTERRGARARSSRRPRSRLGRRAAGRRRPQRPRCDAPLRGARHGRGGPGPLPGRQPRDRAGDPGRLLLRLRAAASAHARRPRGNRGADGRERRRRPSLRAARAAAGGGPGRSSPSAASRSRWRSSTISLAARRRYGEPMPPTSVYEHGPFIDLCKGPHVASHRADRPVQAARGRRARTGAATRSARCSSAIYGTVWGTQEELDTYLWRREEAKKRDHRRLGVQLDLFSFHDVSPGLGVLAPEGPADLAHAGGRDARAPGAARLPGGQHADPRSQEALGAVRPLGPLRREHVHRRERGPDVQPQADELPGKHVHLPVAAALLPRPPAAAVSEYGRLHRNERSGTLVRADPRPAVHPGRRPHLRAARTS